VRNVLAVEDDRFLRMVGIVLDPATSSERRTAYADFFAHDEPDFETYCQRVQARVGKLFPCEVRLFETQAEMRAALPGSVALVVKISKTYPLQDAPRAHADLESRTTTGSIVMVV
jgi:hypothetical protein